MVSTHVENWKRIDQDVQEGRRHASSLQIVFAGLIRNAESSVWRSYEMLKKIGVHFKDYKFLIFENDSEDKTLQIMSYISSLDPRYEFRSERLSMGDERGLGKSRMARMATLRNFVHNWVREFVGRTHQWDLVAIYDFDLNAFGAQTFSPHALFAALGRNETLHNDWDMLCANSIRHTPYVPQQHVWSPPDVGVGVGMYDCFAYRDLHNDSFNGLDCGQTMSDVLFSQYELVPVHSCFGGLALYRPERFLECQYDPDVYDCEHVVFHQCMRQKGSEGRMFLDPLLTTSYDSWIPMGCYTDAASADASFQQDEMLARDRGGLGSTSSFPPKARCHDVFADSERGDNVCNELLAAKSHPVRTAVQCMSFCSGYKFAQWADKGGTCQCYGEHQCETSRAAVTLATRTRVYTCGDV
ncbi:unnamed protein product [Prorocentrum cordatum]|uniref:Hexosyltransferase n=1 Tax=Prorocentrum cordatum TaxID=2364126 RepID=A0ABN9UGF4_9DINO|nr:unnamed protein product [Polarella glacialis]